MLCEYGCGNESKFVMSSGKNCCSEKYNSCPAIRKKNAAGVSAAHADGRIPPNMNPMGNPGWAKGMLRETENTFTYDGKGNHKDLLIKERGRLCESCKNTEWLGNLIPLELEHIDGNNRNNTKENLKLLCCNCHALTPTWRGRNARRESVQKVTDENLIGALQDSYNIREALIKSGLVGKGGNYIRCKKLLETGIYLKTKEIQLDKKNSQYGKIWICHLDKKENKKIELAELPSYIILGWITGRVAKFNGQVAQLVETR